MSKINPKKVQNLIAKGRLVPILGIDKNGKNVLYGYRRKNTRSSKAHEQYMFAEPMALEKTVDPS